jgi:hypothetical protein
MENDPKTEAAEKLYHTNKEPRKSFATFMRNQNKLYVNAFNMIDRKAAIMIRVNAAIISAIIIFFKEIKHVDYGREFGVVMVFCSFLSLVFALNASRPHTFSLLKRYRTKIAGSYKDLKENLFSVGMQPSVSLEEYEKGYHEIVKNQELQVGNQIRAMYLFEQQINRSFKQIEISYGAFIIGFVLVVVGFIYSNLGHIF